MFGQNHDLCGLFGKKCDLYELFGLSRELLHIIFGLLSYVVTFFKSTILNCECFLGFLDTISGLLTVLRSILIKLGLQILLGFFVNASF